MNFNMQIDEKDESPRIKALASNEVSKSNF